MKSATFLVGAFVMGGSQWPPLASRKIISQGLPRNGMKSDERDPAGVESVFYQAKKIRKTQLARLARKTKPGSKNPGGKRRQRRQRGFLGGEQDPIPVGQRAVERMKQQISLPLELENDDKELEALATMRVLLEKDFQHLKDKTVVLPDGQECHVLTQFPDVYGDIRMLRFLRKDRAKNPVSASISYRKFLRWRRDNDVDLVRAQVEVYPYKVPSKLQVISNLLPCDFDGHSFEDSVLISLYVGQWQTSDLARLIIQDDNELSLQDFLLYWTYNFEPLHKQLHAKSAAQKTMVFVNANSDLDGFRIQQLSPSFISIVLKPWVQQLQANYPETAKRIDVIHPPRVVALLWKLITPLLSPGTVAKIRIR
ncbi:SEC14-like protein 1 [Seminavis robusta]|uniref:SEC14-like protein 1 n=1 Tax=Seminavis robusta TaxID=568900 RepID=A0A9N8EXE6_9STRA|nr:SEC14-like protein 1 [Seminavis robusta]|eukprot:Sro2053_g312670.1 SEC14-like protein 1 (367) ;mRNA; f:7152-8252